MTRKINLEVSETQIMQDLEKYREKAMELGASKARILKVSEIPVDERVTLKCQVPRCFGYGVSANCPPNTIKPAELREYLKKYSWAVLFAKEIPPEVIVRDNATAKERISAFQEIGKIVNELESMAFYDGHYLAIGFSAGTCRNSLCSGHETCQALEGKQCRFAVRARPSMEAVGIDVYKLIASSGWDIYPIGSGAKADQVSGATLAGIVIVR